MNKVSLFLILIFLSFLISGCQFFQNTELPAVPDMGLSPNVINKNLELSFWADENTFKIDDDVTLTIHLKSGIQVKSNINFYAKIYLLNRKTKTWVEIPDAIPTTSDGPLFIPETTSRVLDANLRNATVSVAPIIEKKDEDALVLIMVKGELLDANQKTTWVGSYITVTLKP